MEWWEIRYALYRAANGLPDRQLEIVDQAVNLLDPLFGFNGDELPRVSNEEREEAVLTAMRARGLHLDNVHMGFES